MKTFGGYDSLLMRSMAATVDMSYRPFTLANRQVYSTDRSTRQTDCTGHSTNRLNWLQQREQQIMGFEAALLDTILHLTRR